MLLNKPVFILNDVILNNSQQQCLLFSKYLDVVDATKLH